MWKQFLFFSCFMFLSLTVSSKEVKKEERLKCYQCNSFVNSTSCDKLDKSSSIYLLECPDMDDVICRITWIEVNGKKRVVRSCGKNRHHRDCYLTTSIDTKTHTCECNKPGCNKAPTIHSAVINLVIIIWISILLFR